MAGLGNVYCLVYMWPAEYTPDLDCCNRVTGVLVHHFYCSLFSYIQYYYDS
jgi:hypothetical protein